jgi:hypothetical protein
VVFVGLRLADNGIGVAGLRVLTVRRPPCRQFRLCTTGLFYVSCLFSVQRAAGQLAIAASAATHEQPATISGAIYSRLFDLQNSESIQGSVSAFRFGKSYSQLFLSVPDPTGNSKVWSFRYVSSRELHRRYGWRDRSLSPGDWVAVEFYPFHDVRRLGGILISVTPVDGRTLSGGAPADFSAMNAVEYLTAPPMNWQTAFGTKVAWQAVVTSQPTPAIAGGVDGPPSESKVCYE